MRVLIIADVIFVLDFVMFVIFVGLSGHSLHILTLTTDTLYVFVYVRSIPRLALSKFSVSFRKLSHSIEKKHDFFYSM